MTKDVILVVGSLNMDQVVMVPRMPTRGETLLGAGSLKLIPGGKGANQAVAIARLMQHPHQTDQKNAEILLASSAASNEKNVTIIPPDNANNFVPTVSVRMAGRVGNDTFGERLLQALQADQVLTDLVVVDQQEASGVAFIFLSNDDNAIVVAAGANMRVGKDANHFARILAALSQSQALVLQLEIPIETVQLLIAAAHTAQVPVVLNLAPAQQLPRETLAQVTTLVLNESEAALLSGQKVESVEDARIVATVLHGYGIATVVITLGARGALLVTKNAQGEVHSIYQAAPKVRVVDTTAAGDCFVGALTVALTERKTPAEALRFAVMASTRKVTKFGAQDGLPTRAEVLTMSEDEE